MNRVLEIIKNLGAKTAKTKNNAERAKEVINEQRMELISIEKLLRGMAFDGAMTPSNGNLLANKIALISERLGVVEDYI